MANWSGDLRRAGAAERRFEREAKRRQREIERQLKEEAKLSAFEKARLEAQAYENHLDLLLSVHKDRSAGVDWRSLACQLPPHAPPRLARHELLALAMQTDLAEARAADEHEYQAACAVHAQNVMQWEKMQSLARRVLSGESRAYTEAISTSSALTEISNLGSSVRVAVDNAKLVECELKVNGREIIPTDAKSLTASGKLVVKPIPKSRFHEIYQDYVCSCILRLAREMFALLPIDNVILTAVVVGIDSRTGHPAELPVLSLAANRSQIEHLDFEHLDSSDAVQNLRHRGDVMTSRRSGEFIPIIRLSAADVTPPPPEEMDFRSLVAHVKELREQIKLMLRSETAELAAAIEPSELSQ